MKNFGADAERKRQEAEVGGSSGKSSRIESERQRGEAQGRGRAGKSCGTEAERRRGEAEDRGREAEGRSELVIVEALLQL
jgi:hypothetical protein